MNLRSASARMILGLFPPSSRVTFLRFEAPADCAISLPIYQRKESLPKKCYYNEDKNVWVIGKYKQNTNHRDVDPWPSIIHCCPLSWKILLLVPFLLNSRPILMNNMIGVIEIAEPPSWELCRDSVGKMAMTVIMLGPRSDPCTALTSLEEVLRPRLVFLDLTW